MDLDDLLGKEFGPHHLRVCAESVRAYVDVTGDDPSRWIGAAPPGFVSAALFAVAPDLLGRLGDRSVIHGEQTFSWERPMTLESDLEISGTVSKLRDRGGVSFVGFDLAVEDGRGSVASGSSLFLVSGEKTAATSEEEAEPAPDDRGTPRQGERSMSRADLVKYAAATRDWNPIHWDHDAAVAAGLPGVVVHGLAQMAWALQAATDTSGGDRPLAGARVRFRSPLRPATPVRVDSEATDGRVTVSVSDGSSEYLSARIELAEG